MRRGRSVRRRRHDAGRSSTSAPAPARSSSAAARLDTERAARLGHRPGQYRVGDAGGTPSVQRLVNATIDQKLYTSDDWADLEESIELPKQDEDGTEEVSKKISDYLDDATFKGEVADRWGVNLYATTVQKWSDAQATAQQAIWTKTKDELLAEFKDRFVDPEAGGNRNALAKIALGQADEVGGLDGRIVGGGANRATLIQDVTQRYAGYRRQARRAMALAKENYYLYEVQRIQDFVGREPATPDRKAVFNPVVYMEDDAGSSIVDDMNRLHACVLLAMLYERGHSGGGDKLAARGRVTGFLSSIREEGDEGADLGAGLGLGSAHFEDSLKLKNPKLYQAAESLHDYFKGEKEINYDLDKNTEKVMQQSGYEMIVAGNVTWNNLPSALPRGFTLTAGQYIFMIGKPATDTEDSKGHSNTVRVKQDITRATEIETRGDYFEVTNDSSHNFDEDPFGYKIRSIWKKT